MPRNWNGGLHKRCACPRRNWAKCRHSWHFAFKHGPVHHRFSLDRAVGRRIEDKQSALKEADLVRAAIREGTFRMPIPVDPTLLADTRPTLGIVADEYLKKHVAVIPETGEPRRKAGQSLMTLYVAALRRARVPDGHGGTIALEDKRMDDLTVLDVEAIREHWPLKKAAARGGRVGGDRALKRLRHFCNWAVEKGYAERTPFKKGNGVVVVHFAKEQPRRRRLEGDEEQRLLQHASPLLHDLIVAALETGCRKGELMALQWRDVKWDHNVLLVRAEVAKTAEDRDVPMSQQLRALLDMRKHAPDGTVHGPDAFVFGNEVGERVKDLRKAWIACCAAAGIGGLAFHDLRREAASQLRESGAPDHVVAGWLGHANISTTSRYLKTSRSGLQQYLKRFEVHRATRCTAVAQTPSDTLPELLPRVPKAPVSH
jgi:integrase